jgi:hypothetical protein
VLQIQLRKSEEVMRIKIRAFKESLLGIVKVSEDTGYSHIYIAFS